MIILGFFREYKIGEIGQGIIPVNGFETAEYHDQPWQIIKEATLEEYLAQYLEYGGDPEKVKRPEIYFQFEYFYAVSVD